MKNSLVKNAAFPKQQNLTVPQRYLLEIKWCLNLGKKP